MKTKLVYVLTCAPEATYIEQALMAVWSARYWNPSAHIVLLTDDKTSAILHSEGPRGEILQYISEEIVSTFDDDKSMLYRSRWIKTKARELVDGDMLFVDCDTICCRSLESVDAFQCLAGAVLESHLLIPEMNKQMQREIETWAQKVGWSTENEKTYFSSGVLYTKDVPTTHELYRNWHVTWKSGVEKGINIDQPTLAYANIQCNHLIEQIPDSYNCILFTQPQHTREAHILHIAAYRNPSVLFEEKTLIQIRKSGLYDEVLKDLILHPYRSFLPFDYDILHSTLTERLQWIKDIVALKGGYVNAMVCMLRKRFHVLRHRNKIKDNICRG
ncbi:MAG: glycosyltransferase [Lachnospira sp.]